MLRYCSVLEALVDRGCRPSNLAMNSSAEPPMRGRMKRRRGQGLPRPPWAPPTAKRVQNLELPDWALQPLR